MQFNSDYVALALIAFLTVVFLGAAAQGGEIVALADSIMQFGLGAIAGYMSHTQRVGELRELLKKTAQENQLLKRQLVGENPKKSGLSRRPPHYPGPIVDEETPL